MSHNPKFLLYLPNACTLANMSCGILALMLSVFHGSYETINYSCVFLLLGGFLDGIDGRLARKLNVTSQMGKELDSFADAITFGIAPMCVFLAMHSHVSQNSVSLLEIFWTTFYILCAVYRLARYNISDHRDYFLGLPTTASGMFFAIYIFISNQYHRLWAGELLYTILSYGLVLIFGIAMISTVKVNRI